MRGQMVPRLKLRRPRTLRVRFAIAFGLMLGLATLNIGAFYWGARQRDRVFSELQTAVARHSTIVEIRADLEDQYKVVKIVSDLLGVETAQPSRADYERTIQSLNALRQKLATVAQPTPKGRRQQNVAPELATLQERATLLIASWIAFHTKQLSDPGAALSELVMTAEPAARQLLGEELPNAIQSEYVRVQEASDAFVETDRLTFRLVWVILIASGLLSIILTFTLSRTLLNAIAELKTGAERFGAGELAHHVSVRGIEELADVGASLNMMALRLRYAREELEVRNTELATLAFRDPLTLLANRAVFRDRVDAALRIEGRLPNEIAVLFVDLDNFKAVNDTFGHNCGDQLLKDVATRLLSATRGIDTVARLGGDEFAILLDHVQMGRQAIVVAERVIQALGTPFVLEGKAVHVSASIGLAWGKDGEGADEMLRNADVAMYRAKARGKGRYEVFVPEMHAALLDRAQLEVELRAAVEREAFTLVYQPIVQLGDKHLMGFEALARWNHPTRGPVSPATFIPLAEEIGVMQPFGRWVLRQACFDAARWSASGEPGESVAISVNVSSRQLEDPRFTNDVLDALRASSLNPQRLILEITETAIMRDSEVMLFRLNQLKSLGVRLAIDDFGTGYSSLAYLQRFPVDVIKIDKAFVECVATNGNDAALMQAIITLSQALNLTTVAEGIETAEQHRLLRGLGCQFGQGNLFSPGVSELEASNMASTFADQTRTFAA